MFAQIREFVPWTSFGRIAIIKKALQLNVSLYTLLQILSVSVFEKTQLSYALQLNLPDPEMGLGTHQLNLFDF